MASEPSCDPGSKRKININLTMVISWHLVSLCMLLLVITMSAASSSKVDQVISALIKAIVYSFDFGTTADNMLTKTSVDNPVATVPDNSSTNVTQETKASKAVNCSVNLEDACPDDMECSALGGDCIDCVFDESCLYGSKQTTVCTPKPNVNCTGQRKFEREYECRYCYQLPHWFSVCDHSTRCALNKPRNYSPARPQYVSICWTKPEHLCLGRRCFHKQLSCNWSQGYKWSTALLLSIFLGGFGVDRFYLGLWREGIGKLLSFGGLGVWTLVDVILIAVGYIGPWDGSVYI